MLRAYPSKQIIKCLDATAMKIIPKPAKIAPTILNENPKISSILGWASKGVSIIGTTKINIPKFLTHVPIILLSSFISSKNSGIAWSPKPIKKPLSMILV